MYLDARGGAAARGDRRPGMPASHTLRNEIVYISCSAVLTLLILAVRVVGVHQALEGAEPPRWWCMHIAHAWSSCSMHVGCGQCISIMAPDGCTQCCCLPLCIGHCSRHRDGPGYTAQVLPII